MNLNYMCKSYFISCITIFIITCSVYAGSSYPQDNDIYGGELVWGTSNQPTFINPLLTTHSVSMSIQDLLFNKLVRINCEGDIEPDLAKKWEISEDGLEYTFYLRRGVKFHDGIECSAEDVEFTYNTIINPQIKSPFRSHFDNVKSFKAIDRYTFRITLKTPFISLYKLTKEIIPKHLLQNTNIFTSSFNKHPIGTGPFKFAQWTPDNNIVLEANNDYYENRPFLDKIIIKTFSSNQDLWTALMRQEIDFVTFIGRRDYEVLKKDKTFKAYSVLTDYYYAILYNLDDPILSDKNVRKAIAYAIDIKEVIKRVEGGYGKISTGLLHPSSPAFNADINPITYDPQKAISLLKISGWKDRDKDGILDKENKKFMLNIPVDLRNKQYRKIVMAIRQYLAEIGIQTKVYFYNDDNMLTEQYLKSNNINAYLRLFLGGFNPEAALCEWDSRVRAKGKLWSYNKADELFQALQTIRDVHKRIVIYQRIQQLIYDDQPACFLYFPYVFHSVNSRIKNTREFFCAEMPYYTIKDWFITVSTLEKKGGD